jgi:hypothetical protein
MELILLILNANFVVLLLNGFVGVILISVSHVTKNNVMETIYLGSQEINFQNVLAKLAHSKLITQQMGKNMLLDVVFVGI